MKAEKIIPLRFVATLALLLLCAFSGAAQNEGAAKLNERATGEEPKSHAATVPSSAESSHPTAAVTYAYEFEQPEFFIRHIVIEHDEQGRGKISFERRNDRVPLVEPLALSQAAIKRITDNWNALGFLDSNASYQSSKQFPHLGTMRLKIKQGGRERTAEFNWTDNRNASALAEEYRKAADQAIFIFDITLARENQPLEAPKIMSRLDTLLSRKALSDPQQLIPLLEDLTSDERIPLIARNHAERLLKKIKK